MKKTAYLYLASCIAASFQASAQEQDIEQVTVYGQSPLSFVSGLSEYSPASQHLDADALEVH